MPRRCIVGGCSNTEVPLHRWPTNPSLASQWKRFVRDTRSDFTPSATSLVCCLHFELSSFVNILAWTNGFGNLKLTGNAVPTIKRAINSELADKFAGKIVQPSHVADNTGKYLSLSNILQDLVNPI